MIDVRELSRISGELEQRDSSQGAPLLECLVLGLGILEWVVVTVVATWLW